MSDDSAGPAIDIAGAMERMMDSREMFVRTLDRFRGEYRGAVAGIRAALDAGDARRAQRLAHTLKGAAGMIEARGLYRCALGLERALGAPRPIDLPGLLDLTQAALAQVLRQADELLVRPDDFQANRPTASGAGALVRLRALLDVGNGAAVEAMQEAREPLAAAFGPAFADEVARAVHDFDFERALRLLDGAEPGR
jgi:HPt (histidine-containing phosphotransfer) domain-containing protein